MNPTKRNIATDKSWKGLRAQWLGTKQIWEFLAKCELFSSNINEEIKSKKPKDWTPEFCKYGKIAFFKTQETHTSLLLPPVLLL